MSAVRKILSRHSVAPVVLYRIQNSLPVKLRDFTEKRAASFDLVTKLVGKEKMVLPLLTDDFKGPNGMSWRPPGIHMADILGNWKGPAILYVMPVGLVIPKELILIHEVNDHYSLQTAGEVSLKDLNLRLTEFLRTLQVITKDIYHQRHPAPFC